MKNVLLSFSVFSENQNVGHACSIVFFLDNYISLSFTIKKMAILDRRMSYSELFFFEKSNTIYPTICFVDVAISIDELYLQEAGEPRESLVSLQNLYKMRRLQIYSAILNKVPPL